MISRRNFTLALAASPLVLSSKWAGAASAGYPSRPIQFVVGFPPGQASDVGARVIAQEAGAALHASIYVDNKVGAAGIISHQFVKNAAADGYTLLYGSTGTLAINPALYKKLTYNPIKDFEPIILLNSSPMILMANKSLPVRSLQEMIAYVKERPGQISYGSSGYGVTQHIAMEMLKQQTGIDMLHVPYKGSGAMLTDLMGGRVQFAFDTSTAALPHVQAGQLQPLGVSVRERLPQLPAVPTLIEQGLPGFEASTWAGILAPTGTPQPIIETLNAAMNKALQSPVAIKHYDTAASTIRGGSPDDFKRFLAAEIERWGKAVAASGATLD